MQTTTIELAKLIKKCAFELDIHDAQLRAMRRDYSGAYVTSGPTDTGLRICEETARGMNLEPLGTIAYLLLAYTWNDALTWADEQIEN